MTERFGLMKRIAFQIAGIFFAADAGSTANRALAVFRGNC
jgi:hypothetical protein